MKTVDFSESIAASDLKDGTCRQLIEFMKVSIEGQGHFLTLAQDHLHLKIIQPAFLRYHWAILNQILYVSFQIKGNENLYT